MGLAIFSCMRSGLWMSGSGGSGILIARKADGTWSPPSGILLHTSALGFVIGVDIYDCVLVINSLPALEMFTRSRVYLGNDVHLSVGPLIAAATTSEGDDRWRDLNSSVLTYLKARGQHRGVQLDGSLVTERGNENERFYDGAVEVMEVLAGDVRKSIPEIQPLFEVIKAAEGRSDFDTVTMEILSRQPAPGDAVIETPTASPVSPSRLAFGVPNVDDPDPFGVIALEMAGLEIREAGAKLRPTSTQFEYNPSPTSPIFPRFNRQSVDTYLTKSNRGSYMSSRTQATSMTDTGTQTDVGKTPDAVETPDTALSPNHSDDGKDLAARTAAAAVQEPEEIDYTKIDMSSIRHLSHESLDKTVATVSAEPREEDPQSELASSSQPPLETDRATKASSVYPEDERDEDADDEDEEEDEEEAVIMEVATTTQPTRAAIMSSTVTQVIQAKGALVTIPKRIAPPLPARSPARHSRSSKSEFGDVSMISSPLRQSYQSSAAGSLSETREEGVSTGAVEAVEAVEALKASLAAATPDAHQHRPSAILVATDSRFSMESTPETPPTPQAAEHTSSADDSDRGPQTPRPEDDLHREKVVVGAQEPAAGLKIDTAHIAPTAISVV